MFFCVYIIFDILFFRFSSLFNAVYDDSLLVVTS